MCKYTGCMAHRSLLVVGFIDLNAFNTRKREVMCRLDGLMACDSLSLCSNPSPDKQHVSIKRKAMIYLLPAQVVCLLNSNLQMSTLPPFHDVVVVTLLVA